MADRFEAWWEQDKGMAHGEVFKRLSFLADQNREMRQDNLLYLNIQSNWNVDGGGSYGPFYWRTGKNKIRRNIAAAAVDTAASLIAANRTIPSYNTTNGDFSISRKAEQRARVIHAQMWRLGAFELGIDAFYDGACVGTGVTHGYIDPATGLPKLARVMPNSLFFDAAEGRNPRTGVWVHFVPRAQLLRTWKRYREKIEGAAGPTANDWEDYFIREDNSADLVKVVEAWHLPSFPGAGDGKHVIALSNCDLVDEPYKRDRFPFAFYHYARRRAGFWGQGLIERTLPAQLEIAEYQEIIARCRRLASNAVYLVEENSNVIADEITNLEGTVLYYQQTAPQLAVWQGTPQDLVEAVRELAANVFEQEGLAPGVVGGELVQKGLGSARAVRAADDVASRRQVIPTRAMEDYYLQIARLLEDLNDDCAELDPAYEVHGYTRAGRQQFLTTSKWQDLHIPEGNATLSVMSMSATPTTPQGRMAAIDEYIQGGFMSKPVALQLLEFPDISAWQSLETATLDLVEWQIERLLDGYKELPIPQQGAAGGDVLAKKTVNDAYLVAYRMRAPQHILQAFEDYIAYAEQLWPTTAAPQTNAGPAALNEEAAAAAQVNQAAMAA